MDMCHEGQGSDKLSLTAVIKTCHRVLQTLAFSTPQQAALRAKCLTSSIKV